MSPGSDLPPLREVIAQLGLSARKSLGQNFLLDLNLARRIARAGGPLEGCTVLEVGPGPGGLTRALLEEGAGFVLAIERDERCRPALEAIAHSWPGRFVHVAGDALTADERVLLADAPGGPVRVVANLPYNAASAILVKWLSQPGWPPWWQSLTLMFQREVAERIAASPASPAYGRLSALVRWRARARILFDVHPKAFTPAPKVTSSLVRLEPLEQARGEAEIACFERVTAAAFGQRRKMLRQSLRTLGVDPGILLSAAGIDGSVRAEALDVEEFAALARALAAMPRPQERNPAG